MTDKERELFTQALKLITELDKDGTVLEMGLILEMREALAQPEQASTEPPDYVEPPTSDYHNGWEEGFEAAKNLYPKQTKRQWVGLTEDDKELLIMLHAPLIHPDYSEDDSFDNLLRRHEAKLKELNL